MDLCVTHTWAFLLAPTHELTLSYHLFIVKREDWPAISLSCLHNTPKYHVCSHTTNLDRQTNGVVHCFAGHLRISGFKDILWDTCECTLLRLIKRNTAATVAYKNYLFHLKSLFLDFHEWVISVGKKHCKWMPDHSFLARWVTYI